MTICAKCMVRHPQITDHKEGWESTQNVLNRQQRPYQCESIGHEWKPPSSHPLTQGWCYLRSQTSYLTRTFLFCSTWRADHVHKTEMPWWPQRSLLWTRQCCRPSRGKYQTKNYFTVEFSGCVSINWPILVHSNESMEPLLQLSNKIDLAEDILLILPGNLLVL